MTKAEIIREVSQLTHVDIEVAESVIQAFISSVKDSLAGGRNVYLRGFGSFEVRKRAAKVGRNVKEGTSVLIPERRVPVFKPCERFKDRVK